MGFLSNDEIFLLHKEYALWWHAVVHYIKNRQQFTRAVAARVMKYARGSHETGIGNISIHKKQPVTSFTHLSVNSALRFSLQFCISTGQVKKEYRHYIDFL